MNYHPDYTPKYRMLSSYKANYHDRYYAEGELEIVKARLALLWSTYCYEVLDDPTMPDNQWDSLCSYVKNSARESQYLLSVKTEADPNTGQWIHKWLQG